MKYDTEHIEKYLNGELLKAEVKAFEQEIQSDKDFAYEVKLQQTAVETVQYANFMNKIEGIRKEIEEEGHDVKDEKPATVRTARRVMLRRIAAVAAVFLLIPLIYFGIKNINSPSQTVAQIFDEVIPRINSTTTMGTNTASSNVDSIYQAGVTYIEAEKYAQAHKQFDLVIADDKKRPEARFNKAYIYWKEGEKEAAKQQLEKIINDKDAVPNMKEKSKIILNNIK